VLPLCVRAETRAARDNLSVTHPQPAAELHLKFNPALPSEFTAGSKVEIWCSETAVATANPIPEVPPTMSTRANVKSIEDASLFGVVVCGMVRERPG
jgi:hypothetical protein